MNKNKVRYLLKSRPSKAQHMVSLKLHKTCCEAFRKPLLRIGPTLNPL